MKLYLLLLATLVLSQVVIEPIANTRIRWTFTNTEDKEVRLLTRGTPMDYFSDSIFTVVGRGKLVPYGGPVAKRMPPTDDEYVTVPAHGSISETVNIAAMYGPLEAGQTYTVTFHAPISQRLHTSNSVQIVAAVATDPLQFHNIDLTPSNGATNLHCNTNQANANLAAGNAAKSRSSTLASSGGSITTWFGTTSSGTIRSHYSALNTAFGGSFKVECTPSACRPGVFAFVYKGDSTHTINVCDAYWSASGSWGWDSKPGVLLHEMTHFNNVIGTSDFVYGVQGCKDLAKNSPSQAAMNADSHEYFAESS